MMEVIWSDSHDMDGRGDALFIIGRHQSVVHLPLGDNARPTEACAHARGRSIDSSGAIGQFKTKPSSSYFLVEKIQLPKIRSRFSRG